MKTTRVLNWDGCSNVRDFGGITTEDGQQLQCGAFARSDHPNRLSSEGWEALYSHGIRTIISLETDGMKDEGVELPENLQDIDSVAAAIEDLSDQEFLNTWAATDLWCTPLYYQDAITRWPKRHAAVFSMLAQAKEGGVLIHCKRGNDRTGIISMMLLTLLGVSPEDIVDDYMMSPDSERDKILKERNTTPQEVILDTIKDLDMESYLMDAGLTEVDIEKIKDRMLASS